MTEGLILETHFLLPGFEELVVFPLCYQRAFLYYSSFISTSQLLLPVMCPSPQFEQLDSFGPLFVLSLVKSSSSYFRQIPFCLQFDFCMFVFVVIMTYHVSVFVLFYSGDWLLFGDRGIIWLLLQVEDKKYCRSVEVPWPKKNNFNCFSDDLVRFL